MDKIVHSKILKGVADGVFGLCKVAYERELKPYLDKKYSVSDIYIFGSFARNEQTDESDIDALVDFRKTPDLLTFIEIEEFISKNLHHKIDFVPKRKLKAQLKEQIMEEAIAI